MLVLPTRLSSDRLVSHARGMLIVNIPDKIKSDAFGPENQHADRSQGDKLLSRNKSDRVNCLTSSYVFQRREGYVRTDLVCK